MKDFFHKLFIPHSRNNYRAKILHDKSLLFFITLSFLGGFFLNYIRLNFPSVLGVSSNISPQELILLTNQDRERNGLPPLSINPELSSAAENKAENMFSENYWAHDSPDGKTPWNFIRASGYNYLYAGENLAKGFNSAYDVVNAWMASPEHRSNMLSPNYRDVGFAVATGKLNGEETVLVVEMLGSTQTSPIASKDLQPKKEAPSRSLVASNPQNADAIQKTFAKAQKDVVIKPLVDSASFSSGLTKGIISLFIFSLVLDMIIVERRKIVRFVGHNLDHVFLLVLILIFIASLIKGAIV